MKEESTYSGKSILQEKSYLFALKSITAYSKLTIQKEFILSKQFLRSATAIGALVEEAKQAESRADFIHKLSISNKEANETRYWIRLLIDSNYFDLETGQQLQSDCEELIRLLIASIKTSKSKK